mmetsp:Transcript_2401/g.5670  ORF Transcript_2401/g.5670 Transcript_2401/m.5670 type:complete len:610 (+) Transcript_2401:122-1951(+)
MWLPVASLLKRQTLVATISPSRYVPCSFLSCLRFGFDTLEKQIYGQTESPQRNFVVRPGKLLLESNTLDETKTSTAAGMLIGMTGTVFLLGALSCGESRQCTRLEAVQTGPPSQDVTEELEAWLKSRGADLSGLYIASSPKAGLGLFASGAQAAEEGGGGVLRQAARLNPLRWVYGRSRRVLARFPASSAITAEAVTSGDSAAAAGLRELVGLGAADGSTAVICHLALERARGDGSPLQPWLRALPRGFPTPLHYDDSQLEALRGTALHAATKAKMRHLHAQWLRLEPTLRVICKAEGIARPPGFEDFLWAFSAFWSRALSMPAAVEGPGDGARVEMRAAILPGLDLCNHSPGGCARWSVFDGLEERPVRAAAGEIKLIAEGRRFPARGEEVTISYGDQSNEELLFHYGFTVKDNPNDMLMMHLPLPPQEEWDEVMQGRMLLLMSQGLTPQFFLPATPEPPNDGRKASWPAEPLRLPDEVWTTLDTLVMDRSRLAKSLEGAGLMDTERSPAGPPPQKGEPGDPGHRMAILSTLIRMLEYKVMAMEGEEGTGSLENDVLLLKEIEGGKHSEAWFVDCLRYRMGQKQIARDYLARCRVAMREVMDTMSKQK